MIVALRIENRKFMIFMKVLQLDEKSVPHYIQQAPIDVVRRVKPSVEPDGVQLLAIFPNSINDKILPTSQHTISDRQRGSLMRYESYRVSGEGGIQKKFGANFRNHIDESTRLFFQCIGSNPYPAYHHGVKVIAILRMEP